MFRALSLMNSREMNSKYTSSEPEEKLQHQNHRLLREA